MPIVFIVLVYVPTVLVHIIIIIFTFVMKEKEVLILEFDLLSIIFDIISSFCYYMLIKF